MVKRLLLPACSELSECFLRPRLNFREPILRIADCRLAFSLGVAIENRQLEFGNWQFNLVANRQAITATRVGRA